MGNMHTETYKIKGMHCASCAVIIENEFKKADGVELAEANYGNESVKVSFDETKIKPDELSKKIEHLGYSLIFPKKDLQVQRSEAKEMGPIRGREGSQ